MTLNFQRQFYIQPPKEGGGGGGTSKGAMLPQEVTFGKFNFKAEGELQQ